MVAAGVAITLGTGWIVMGNDAETTAPAVADLMGHWQLVSSDGCKDRYPNQIELREFGVYATADGVEIGARWHGGEWTLEDTTLKVQAANDEMLRYTLTDWSDGKLQLQGDGDCVLLYARPAD